MLFLLSEGIILLAPAVIGLFWGAPLIARELETGTAAVAWNQSVTRTRWLAVKLTVIGLTAMAVTEALSLMQTWWAAPISQAVADGASVGPAQSRFTQLNFATHGLTPLGYAAFAFVLGVTAGALIRRTVPAMAVTLAIFAALQVAMPLWVRPNLAPPDRTVIPVTSLGAAIPSETGAGGTIFTLYAVQRVAGDRDGRVTRREQVRANPDRHGDLEGGEDGQRYGHGRDGAPDQRPGGDAEGEGECCVA